MSTHLVRIGAMGHVGRFLAVDRMRYPRATRVVVRTARGLEVGEVLAEPDGQNESAAFDGDLLRPMAIEDELLAARIEQHRQEAYDACATLLAERALPAVLIDVEHLFDGQGIYFYFLGDVSPEIEACTAELAEAYETKVQFRKFTETLIEGCGPGCGTEAAKGQGGCETCSGCAVASACGTGKISRG
jgi:cell fate regulator YaaT (PSP1 superfamily)